MKLTLLLNLVVSTITFVSFGMNHCPNTSHAERPRPYLFALLPAANNDNEDRVHNENLKPILNRFRQDFVFARAEQRAYPLDSLAEITAVIATIPFDKAEERRNFAALKEGILQYNEKFQ